MNMVICFAEKSKAPITIIEVRPFRNGWKVFESRGVETDFTIAQIRAISTKTCAISALTALAENGHFARFAQINALRLSDFVRLLGLKTAEEKQGTRKI
jgi:hypothetical protein